MSRVFILMMNIILMSNSGINIAIVFFVEGYKILALSCARAKNDNNQQEVSINSSSIVVIEKQSLLQYEQLHLSTQKRTIVSTERIRQISSSLLVPAWRMKRKLSPQVVQLKHWREKGRTCRLPWTACLTISACRLRRQSKSVRVTRH